MPEWRGRGEGDTGATNQVNKKGAHDEQEGRW